MSRGGRRDETLNNTMYVGTDRPESYHTDGGANVNSSTTTTNITVILLSTVVDVR